MAAKLFSIQQKPGAAEEAYLGAIKTFSFLTTRTIPTRGTVRLPGTKSDRPMCSGVASNISHLTFSCRIITFRALDWLLIRALDLKHLLLLKILMLTTRSGCLCALPSSECDDEMFGPERIHHRVKTCLQVSSLGPNGPGAGRSVVFNSFALRQGPVYGFWP